MAQHDPDQADLVHALRARCRKFMRQTGRITVERGIDQQADILFVILRAEQEKNVGFRCLWMVRIGVQIERNLLHLQPGEHQIIAGQGGNFLRHFPAQPQALGFRHRHDSSRRLFRRSFVAGRDHRIRRGDDRFRQRCLVAHAGCDDKDGVATRPACQQRFDRIRRPHRFAAV